MIKPPRSSPFRYAAATLAVALATGIRLSLQPILAGRQPFVFFYFAVVFAAWNGGSGPSVLAVVLSIASATCYFLRPFNPADLGQLADTLAVVNFVAVCAAIIAFGESNRAARVQLEAEVAERARAEAKVTEQARLAEYGRTLGQALARSTDLGDMLTRCAEATVRHLDAAFARIWTVDDSGEVLDLRASAGISTHLDGRHGRYKIGQIALERLPHLT